YLITGTDGSIQTGLAEACGACGETRTCSSLRERPGYGSLPQQSAISIGRLRIAEAGADIWLFHCGPATETSAIPHRDHDFPFYNLGLDENAKRYAVLVT